MTVVAVAIDWTLLRDKSFMWIFPLVLECTTLFIFIYCLSCKVKSSVLCQGDFFLYCWGEGYFDTDGISSFSLIVIQLLFKSFLSCSPSTILLVWPFSLMLVCSHLQDGCGGTTWCESQVCVHIWKQEDGDSITHTTCVHRSPWLSSVMSFLARVIYD